MQKSYFCPKCRKELLENKFETNELDPTSSSNKNSIFSGNPWRACPGSGDPGVWSLRKTPFNFVIK
jgi:hypothetical protein